MISLHAALVTSFGDSDPMILGANRTVSGKASDVEVYNLVILQ